MPGFALLPPPYVGVIGKEVGVFGDIDGRPPRLDCELVLSERFCRRPVLPDVSTKSARSAESSPVCEVVLGGSIAPDGWNVLDWSVGIGK